MAVIGGRAHINGISFVTNTHIIRGKISKGTVSIDERRLPGIRIFKLMDKVPFLRGVSMVAKLNHKLFLASLLLLAIPWDWILPYDILVVSKVSRARACYLWFSPYNPSSTTKAALAVSWCGA